MSQVEFAPRMEFSTEPAAFAYLELYGNPGSAPMSAMFDLATTLNGGALNTTPGVIEATRSTDRFVVTGAVPIHSVPPGDYLVRAVANVQGHASGRVIRTLRIAAREPMNPVSGYNRAVKHRFPPRIAILVPILLVLAAPSAPLAQARRQPSQAGPYFPDRFQWEQRKPDQAGMDAALVEAAIKFAVANENPAAKDLAVDLATTFGGREPFDTPIGPIQPRGALNGLIVRHGFVVAEWGDTSRVDMTFSVTKSFLSTVVGLAWQKGLIRDVHDLVRDYVPQAGLFDGPHNSKITWDHLLRQTSDWQGTLWGKPDWADRPEGQRPADWPNRPLSEPGTRYKYNDVRVNLLALCALHVLRRPLPQVLREEVMEPIGASSTWRWHGYDNSWIELDGQRMQSMTGGGHWGGGMFISARDMARFGYLFLRNGKWKDREIVSPKWIEMARTPGPANKTYGYMNWFLNTETTFSNAPATAVTFQGNGSNIIYIDWENDLVVVVRWIQQRAFNEFIGQVLGAIADRSGH